MAELDSLIDSKISLISQEDVKFDGTLFSINAEESSMVLKNVVCLGTEDRVRDPSRMVAANSVIIPFVTFPGSEIKDLIVHDPNNAPAPPAKTQQQNNKQQQRPQKNPNPPRPPANNNNTNNQKKPTHRDNQQQQQQQQQQAPAPRREPRVDGPGAGTGAHLLNLREKKAPDASESNSTAANQGEFDFSAGLDLFKKNDVLATLGGEVNTQDLKYKKDDFFDSLTSDAKGAGDARKARMSASEERSLNQDTFGAIA
eukprot:CAMPEP_0176244764 /NCGR_PEP_ID=MMETSP0121_2-20121125/31598_1 /TAXON_ID=160619 /ORGANISM="Kryptoperidinium foliaceum, Strain CCMP 1326" /LENGTH=255 /DNA_ID=CAMNT_0017584379 /DNA_START=18 /DNA_END=782 /DNA_ORIENTATION=-